MKIRKPLRRFPRRKRRVGSGLYGFRTRREKNSRMCFCAERKAEYFLCSRIPCPLRDGFLTRRATRIDEAVALVFTAPKSYTGEDVVELSCHGGLYVMQRLLEATIAAGAFPAQPGELQSGLFKWKDRFDFKQKLSCNDFRKKGRTLQNGGGRLWRRTGAADPWNP